MARRRVVVPLALVSFGCAVACNAIIGLGGDYDLGAADAAAGTDSSLVHVDGAVVTQPDGTAPPTSDAGPDGSSPDGGGDAGDSGPPVPVFDAAPPASFVPDAGFTKWCPASFPTGEFFCWDFFGSDPPPLFGWSDAGASGGATIDVDGDGGTTERAFHADLPAAATEGASGMLFWNFGQLAIPVNGTLAVDFSFRITSDERFAVVAALSSNTTYGLAVHPRGCSDVTCLSDNQTGTGFPNQNLAAGFTMNTWYRGRITMQRNATAWTATVSVGGRTIGTESSVPFTTGGNPSYHLEIGLFDSTGTGANDINIDDVAASMF